MPVSTPRPSKRKHADGERSGGKETKEERRAEKRAKREAEAASPTRATKSKSKQVPSEFKLVRARTSISLPPRFAGDARRGVEEILDNLVMRYVPSLRGVLLSHKEHAFASNVALMYAEGPYPTTQVEFDAGVWAPEIGMRITGRISLHATDHIGLLVHRTFNAAIDRVHIPDGWEYVHGPVENDPEINDEEREGDEQGGRWVNSQSSETLGGESGLVEFTVIGYTIANQMLSLHGSLQSDPFASEYYTARQTTTQPAEPAENNEVRIEGGSDDEIEVDEEELAAPRGTKRRVVNDLPVSPEPHVEAEVTQVKKKKKKGVVEGEASVAVLEAAANTAEQEGKKKRKRKKTTADNTV